MSFPTGYSCIFAGSVDSTNVQLCHLARQGRGAGLWFCADMQLSGRGRMRRDWVSPPGNLYASILVRLGCAAARCCELSFVGALAFYDCASQIISERGSENDGGSEKGGDVSLLSLKWPNDILLGGKKCGGILLEHSGVDDLYVIGFGMNLVSSPRIAAASGATDFLSHGYIVDRDFALHHLAKSFAARFEMWRLEGFSSIRRAWLSYAHRVGSCLSVFVDGAYMEGEFIGIDDYGFLLLRDDGGVMRRIMSADIGLTGAFSEGG